MKKLMFNMFTVALLVLGISCNNEVTKPESKQTGSNLIVTDTTNSKADTPIVKEKDNYDEDNYYSKIENLNNDEVAFLKKISQENEFMILSAEAERIYSRKDNSLLLSKLIFSKQTLQEKGYIFFELKFYGKISDVNLSYAYSLGQASYGYGNVVGIDVNNYLHTLQSCGVTACITQLFQNGQKIFEKSN